MHITKSLFLAVIGLGAMAIADVATENEAARPSAFCDSLSGPERTECKRDRLEYCKRLVRDTAVRDACKHDDPWRGSTPNTVGGYGYQPGPPPPGPAPAPFDQECDTGRFEDLPNRCLRQCRNSGPYNQPPWCARHCAKYQRKGERGPDWCYAAPSGGPPPPQYGQPGSYGPPGPPPFGQPGRPF